MPRKADAEIDILALLKKTLDLALLQTALAELPRVGECVECALGRLEEQRDGQAGRKGTSH
ncbi:hypothetical protein GCM10023219_20730 [Stakelama sediminis]